jgi:4-amino-4-deoxy-L-arabinose transferase-like glycosyltransferase
MRTAPLDNSVADSLVQRRAVSWPRTWAVALVLLTLAYLGTRLPLLMNLPVFVDEAIHIQWAQQTLQGDLKAGLWDGKWLSIKLMALFLILPLHPLEAARLASVFAGFASVLACVMIGTALYSRMVGLIAGLAYIVMPYALFNDRMALTDGFQTAFGAWALFAAIMHARAPTWRSGAALLILLLGAVLAKISGIILVLVPLLVIAALARRQQRVRAALWAAPAILAPAALLALFTWRGAGTYQLFSKSSSVSLADRLENILRNIGMVADWYWTLLTPPLAVFAAVAVIWPFFRRERRGIMLALVLAAVIAPYIAGATTWFFRYLLFTTVPLALLIAALLADCASWARGRSGAWLLGIAALLLAAWPLALDLRLVANPRDPAVPFLLRDGYVMGWTSGEGLPDAAAYLSARAAESPDGINVLRFYFWDHPYQGLDLYLAPSTKLSLHTLDPSAPEVMDAIAELTDQRPTYFVVNPSVDDEQLKPTARQVADYLGCANRAWHYTKPDGDSRFEIWSMAPCT